MSEPDYSAYKEKPTDDLVSRIIKTAEEQVDLKAEVAMLTLRLDQAKSSLKFNIEEELPGLMDEAGQDVFSSQDGKIRFNLNERIFASVPKDNPYPAFKWLEMNGEGRLIKNKFTVEVDNLDKQGSIDLTKHLEECGHEFKHDRSVHHSSLSSCISNMMKDGVDVPQDKFNVAKKRTCKLK